MYDAIGNINYTSPKKRWKIEGYQTIREIKGVSVAEDGNIQMIQNNEKIESMELTKFIETLIDKKEQSNAIGDDYFRANTELILNEKQKIIITYLHISYEKTEKEIRTISLEGYVLER